MAQSTITNGQSGLSVRTALNTMFNDLYTLTASQGSTISTNSSNITTLQGQMTTANSNITTLQGQMTTANSNIATNAASIVTTNGNVTTLSGTVTTLSGNLTALTTRVTTLESIRDHPGYFATNWYGCVQFATLAVGTAGSNGTAHFTPFRIFEKVTISDLGIRVTTLFAASNFQLAIYAMDATTKLPTGSQLAATGNISGAAANLMTADITGADVQLNPGWYYLASNQDSGTLALGAILAASAYGGPLLGSTTTTDILGASSSSALHLTTPLTFGTWGNVTAAVWTRAVSLTMPNGIFKVASVP